MTSTTLTQLEHHDEFIGRHIGPSADEQKAMLEVLGADSLEALTKDTGRVLSCANRFCRWASHKASAKRWQT